MRFNNDGWLDSGLKVNSPNFNQGSNPREVIVMHYTASYTAQSAIDAFKKRGGASAHFVVEVDGTITQMVSANDRAFHAGPGVYHGRSRVNDFSIGIEIVNPGYHFKADNGSWLNWDRKPVTAGRLNPFPGMLEAQDPWVGSARQYWPLFPEDQLKAVEGLTKALLKSYRSLVDIVGHRDIDTVRRWKVDPGPAFPMMRFRRLIDRRDDEVPVVTYVVEAPGGLLNVRGGPGTSFGTLDWGPLRNSQQVERLEARGEWYRVRRWIEGVPQEGWVYAAYLKPAG
jgi:N-acetylmuramoyl-L-alanine amidase